MTLLFPVLAAILQATSFTLDKVILSVSRVTSKTYLGVSFPLIFLFSGVAFFLFQPPLSWGLILSTWPWLLVTVSLTIITNLIFYRALDHDHLSEIQTIDLLQNIPVILFSSLFFSDERNLSVIFFALIASLAVIWSHWKAHHFHMAKRTWTYFLWVLCVMPLGVMTTKVLLTSWNPISLEFIRSGAVALMVGPLFFRFTQKTPPKAVGLLILTNILTTIAWILFYFSYQRSGIVYTILVFSLQPLLVYVASLFFLKERFHWKKALAFVLVLLSILSAQIFG